MIPPIRVLCLASGERCAGPARSRGRPGQVNVRQPARNAGSENGIVRYEVECHIGGALRVVNRSAREARYRVRPLLRGRIAAMSRARRGIPRDTPLAIAARASFRSPIVFRDTTSAILALMCSRAGSSVLAVPVSIDCRIPIAFRAHPRAISARPSTCAVDGVLANWRAGRASRASRYEACACDRPGRCVT